jgi:hypothetical protein
MLLPALVAAFAPASAATCDAQVAKVGSLAAADAADAYAALVKCDKKVAENNFKAFLEKATDADAAVALFLVAVDSEVWTPVWGSLSKVTSYEARDEIAQRVGEACTDHPKVVSFLQGAYFGLKDIEFQQWDDGFRACADPALGAWVEKQVAAPPSKQFDEKYNALLDIFVKARHVDALPALTTGAVKAATGNGPFDPMLQKMGESVAPELGGQTSPEDQKKLEEALVSVAKQVPVDKARSVANQLANSGADAAAAGLLPTLFPDRVQGGGGFLYGAVAVEAGECGGKKAATLHYATVSEPGKRWSIVSDLETPMRAGKAKLGKDCTGVESPWPIVYTPEPVKAAGDVDKWLQTIQADWEGKGYAVKAQKEKAFSLP